MNFHCNFTHLGNATCNFNFQDAIPLRCRIATIAFFFPVLPSISIPVVQRPDALDHPVVHVTLPCFQVRLPHLVRQPVQVLRLLAAQEM